MLEKTGGTKHGYCTRQGGGSQGAFASLNCGYGSGDDQNIVRSNRAWAMNQLGLQEHSLVTAYQTHSANITVVTKTWSPEAAPKVDGMVSQIPGITLGILTADCAPVLFVDSVAGVIGAAHAGWRGAKDGVLGRTLEAMTALGAKAERVTAVVGPCIQQESYEVSDSFYDAFLADDTANQDFFIPSDRPKHHRFDLPGYIMAALNRYSVGTIESLKLDTYTDEDRFFSYRRTTHHQEKQYGRLLSVIALDPPQNF